jgi:hypothetical protein
MDELTQRAGIGGLGERIEDRLVGECFFLVVGEILEREGGAEPTVDHYESRLRLLDDEGQRGIAMLAGVVSVNCKVLS